MAGRMAVLRGGDLNGPATPRQRWSVPQHNTQWVGVHVTRPTPGVHSPSPALRRSWQRGPLGPAPLRFGPPAAHSDERVGLRGRPLSVASCNQGSWKGATAARVGLLCYVQFSLVPGGVRASL